ncbi:hypothetical protein AKO1_007990 [Acrasis kona]|uniref:RGS domain-containing protein n=1 Tax=Acrasis kona TaxID=1008807 RepID=A0AAW2YPU5_9EUKA
MTSEYEQARLRSIIEFFNNYEENQRASQCFKDWESINTSQTILEDIGPTCPTKIKSNVLACIEKFNSYAKEPTTTKKTESAKRKSRTRRNCLYSTRSMQYEDSPISLPIPTSLNSKPKTPMEQILSVVEFKEGLLEFAKLEHCEECVQFLLELHMYKKSTGVENRKVKADDIYKKYVIETSPQEVNVSAGIKQKLRKRIKGDDEECPITYTGIDIFDEIEAAVGFSVADIFLRYTISESFSKITSVS